MVKLSGVIGEAVAACATKLLNAANDACDLVLNGGMKTLLKRRAARGAVVNAAACVHVEQMEERLLMTAPPNVVISPVNGTDWYKASGSDRHTASGGIGGADDFNAMDWNRPNNADLGAAVYSVADGWVERNIGNGSWGGSSSGQLLLKHLNPDGSIYYTGYLHMTNITGLKATQGAFIPGGTRIGDVGFVGLVDDKGKPDVKNAHLHVAVYEWEGNKLRSRSTSLVQKTERPKIAVVGNISINNQVVRQSPFAVSRNAAFTMVLTVRNNGADTMNGNFHLILTRDQNGAQFVGKVSDLGQTANLRPGTEKSLRFTKSSFSSPAGTYFLQVYYEDGSSGGGAALKRVSGTNPIAITLK